MAAYLSVTLIVLAPVLLTSVGADDSYWILKVAPESHGSYWHAVWDPLSQAFAFNGQPRTTALAYSGRNLISLLTTDLATAFAVPPAVIWAAIKVSLLAIGVVAVAVFLRQLSFRDRDGRIRRLQPASIAFITLSFPLTVAIAAKSQNVANLNGWNFYPTLSYGPIAVYLLLATLVLKSSALLQRNYRTWAVPVIALMAVIALALNLSYELLALTIPLCVGLLILQPTPADTTRWMRWRGKLTVLLTLAGTYSAIFVWIRLRISEMACQATGTCYAGSVPELNTHTLWNNFFGAFPGGTGAFVSEQAGSVGREFPGINPGSLFLAVVGAAALAGLWISWLARRTAGSEVPLDEPAESRDDVRGLLVVIVTGLVIAVGSAVISGITANAVDQVQTPMLSYRTSVVTWSALALAGLAAVRLLTLVALRPARLIAPGILLLIIITSVSLYFPRNVMSAQINRAEARTQSIDDMHWEIVLGSTSAAGDARRCASIRAHRATYRQNIARFDRTVAAVYAAYEFYHHQLYCSTGEGLKK